MTSEHPSTSYSPSDSASSHRSEESVAEEQSATDRMVVSPRRLIVGSMLQFPLFDQRDVLLLAAGQTVTMEFKQRLLDRGLEEVEVHREDSWRLGEETSVSAVASPETAPRKSSPRPPLGVTNTGPAIRDSMVQHGCLRYDPAHRAGFIETNHLATRYLDATMQQAVRGGEIDCGGVLKVADGYLQHLVTDMSSVLTVPFANLPDQAIASHCLQMSLYGMAIAIEMNLDAQHVQRIGMAGLVHDWGLMRVPREIRQAQRRLNPAERLEIRKHPAYSLDLIERSSGFPAIVPHVVHQVHEKSDGSGYPRGRKGNAIHPFARILHVADRYVALVSPRPHRAPSSPYAAIEELLRSDRGCRADPQVIRALLRVVSLFPIGSFVQLSDGSRARVLRGNGDQYASPIVRIVRDANGREVDERDEAGIVDLLQSTLRISKALPTPGLIETARAPHYHRLGKVRLPMRRRKSAEGTRTFRDPAGIPNTSYYYGAMSK